MIKQLAEHLGLPMKGNRTKAVWRDSNSWNIELYEEDFYDFATSSKGNDIELVKLVKNIGTDEAIQYLRDNNFRKESTPEPIDVSSIMNIIHPPKTVEHVYLNESGFPIFKVVRKEYNEGGKRIKDFAQMRHENNKWYPSVKVVTLIPYMLDRWHDSPNIIIHEGEKCADLCWNLFGIPSTSFAGGAGKWQEHYTDYFHGKHVVVFADNDRNKNKNSFQKGIWHAELVADKLKKVAKSVKVICPAKDPNGGDFEDFTIEGGTKESLFDIINKTKEHIFKNTPKTFKEFSDDDIELSSSLIKEMPRHLRNPDIPIIGHINDWYEQKSLYEQIFGVQTALATLSTFLGRRFKTSLNNPTKLYLMTVAQTGQGKDLGLSMSRKLLQAMYEPADDLPEGVVDHGIVGPDSFNSDASIFSTLFYQPCFLCATDEIASEWAFRDQDQKEKSRKKLVEMWNARIGEVFKPDARSIGSKVSSEAPNATPCYDPSITILGATTPEVLVDSIEKKDVQSGWLNRWLVLINPHKVSPPKNVFRKMGQSNEIPQDILTWAQIINNRYKEECPCGLGVYTEMHRTSPASYITLSFTDEALQVCEDTFMEQHILVNQNKRMGGMYQRYTEMSMRIALIVALARDPMTSLIKKDDIIWSKSYVKYCINSFCDYVNPYIVETNYEFKLKRLHKIILDCTLSQSGSATKLDLSEFTDVYGTKDRELFISALLDSERIRSIVDDEGITRYKAIKEK